MARRGRGNGGQTIDRRRRTPVATPRAPAVERTEGARRLQNVRAARRLEGVVGPVDRTAYRASGAAMSSRAAVAGDRDRRPSSQVAARDSVKGAGARAAAGDTARRTPDRCKSRPSGRGGNGGSRPFVPWCK